MTTFLDWSLKHPRYQINRPFYDRIRNGKADRGLVDRLVIPPNNGKGFIVRAGQTFRVIQEEGSQIADVAFWNADNPAEHFGGARTWLLEGWIVRPYSRMWSELPWLRPMMTCVEDTVDTTPRADYHHHFMGIMCSPESVERRAGVAGSNACRLNLLQAIEPFGLNERYIRENVNVHEKNRLDPLTGQRSIGTDLSRKGDYIEFYAEMDLLVGVSVCPYGDGTTDPTDPKNVIRPLGIEIHDTGIPPNPFPKWSEWRHQVTLTQEQS